MSIGGTSLAGLASETMEALVGEGNSDSVFVVDMSNLPPLDYLVEWHYIASGYEGCFNYMFVQL